MRREIQISDETPVGRSEAFLALQASLSRAARTDRPVILIGERGTGKELAAAAIHRLSDRWNQPYVTLNCASLSPTLLESELFGHEAGAFTGAVRMRKGRFETAHRGTFFLDEVGIIPMPAQEKILRAVEYGRFERVGATDSVQTDVRLIAATNVNLGIEAREGRFRADLLDRLSFEVIVLPPLREREGDMELLAGHFARRMAVELGREEMPEFSSGARARLAAHTWPGNVRELKNVIERAVYRSEGGKIEEIVLDPFDSPWMPKGSPAEGAARGPEVADMKAGDCARESAGSEDPVSDGSGGGGLNPDDLPLQEAVREYEIGRITSALAEARFSQRRAAELLGLTYNQFRGYYRKYKDRLEADSAG